MLGPILRCMLSSHPVYVHGLLSLFKSKVFPAAGTARLFSMAPRRRPEHRKDPTKAPDPRGRRRYGVWNQRLGALDNGDKSNADKRKAINEKRESDMRLKQLLAPERHGLGNVQGLLDDVQLQSGTVKSEPASDSKHGEDKHGGDIQTESGAVKSEPECDSEHGEGEHVGTIQTESGDIKTESESDIEHGEGEQVGNIQIENDVETEPESDREHGEAEHVGTIQTESQHNNEIDRQVGCSSPPPTHHEVAPPSPPRRKNFYGYTPWGSLSPPSGAGVFSSSPCLSNAYTSMGPPWGMLPPLKRKRRA